MSAVAAVMTAVMTAELAMRVGGRLDLDTAAGLAVLAHATGGYSTDDMAMTMILTSPPSPPLHRHHLSLSARGGAAVTTAGVTVGASRDRGGAHHPSAVMHQPAAVRVSMRNGNKRSPPVMQQLCLYPPVPLLAPPSPRQRPHPHLWMQQVCSASMSYA